MTALKVAVVQAERKMESTRSGYRAQLENERLEAIAQVNRIGQEREKSSVKADMLEIRAPGAGVVKDLAVTAPGAVVQAGALLMNLVPRDEPLIAEVLLGNEDAGFVAPGQRVQVKVAAYPFQKYGLVEGTVTHIAADATQLQGGQQPLAYRVWVKLSGQQLAGRPEPLQLVAGMLVTAEIHQGERTVLEYLLSPVQKVGLEAARER